MVFITSFHLALEAEELYRAVEALQHVPGDFLSPIPSREPFILSGFPALWKKGFVETGLMLGRSRARETRDQHGQTTACCQSGLIRVPVNRLFGHTCSSDEAVSEGFQLSRYGRRSLVRPRNMSTNTATFKHEDEANGRKH